MSIERALEDEKIWEEFQSEYPGSYSMELFSEWFRRRLWKDPREAAAIVREEAKKEDK